jgi:2-phospho-L-lactate/phosphoenolpyruvate guanylyltransferase
MRTLAILPIKRFGQAKQRLGAGMTPGSRRALTEAMYSDVLVALRRAGSVDEVLVVSADQGAQQIAGGYGATVLGDDDQGHNPAATRGIRAALESGAQRVLLVAGDCPLIDPAELDQLIERNSSQPSVLIVPDRHRTGTNALLLTPPGSLDPGFGPGSCQRHVETALNRGTAPEIVEVPSLALDVDTPEDLDALRAQLEATHGGAAHTRGMMRRLTRSQL